jgi:hypothetical protein
VDIRALSAVTLEHSAVAWGTYVYELAKFYTIRAGPFDGPTRAESSFEARVLVNEYLQVTLVPQFGGRMLTQYKPTGHDQLDQNSVGCPTRSTRTSSPSIG